MSARPFSASFPSPERMSLSGNVASKWRRFKQNFLNYSIASRLSNEFDTGYQTSVFLATIREECFDINEELQFDDEEQKNDLSEVINKFKEFFIELKDKLIRSQVVVGVKDNLLKEKLLADKKLTLDKYLQIEHMRHQNNKQKLLPQLSMQQIHN
uniref:Uncharacterized protein n=1 Tax=Octopus bimaculoides TaxID=37653 RepID=A0A0L8G8K7_OCTBM